MNKKQLIARYEALLKEIKEDSHTVVLSGGAALVILGLRERTSMLVAIIPPNLFNYLATKRHINHRKHIEPFIQMNYVTRIHSGDEDTGVVCVDGIWMLSPSELIKQRRKLVNFPNRNPHRLRRDLEEIRQLEDMARSSKITARAVTPA